MELMEDGTTIEQQMFTMATEKKVPLYGVLELLPLCNLNCDMCYVRMSREEMEEVGRLRTMEEWTKTAEDMMKARDTICSFDRWRAVVVSTFPRVISKTP